VSVNLSGDPTIGGDVKDQAVKEDHAAKAGETFAMKTERIRASSPYAHLPGWGLDGLICKSNDDLRQEVMKNFSKQASTSTVFLI
jgi:hypothetical protein